MGMRRRRRRRAVVAGAAIASSASRAPDDQQQSYETQEAPPPAEEISPADPAEEIQKLAQLHDSGALTDDEFAAAKAKVLAG